jgi:transglutaminase-like putative cysteine protease
MQNLRIIHLTEYHYKTDVGFGTHVAMLRPREGHDVHIHSAKLEISPTAEKRWLRDIYGNSIAVITFAERSTMLRILSEVDVEISDDDPRECLIDPSAREYPFQYAPSEQMEIIPYRVPSYPYDGIVVQNWLREIYKPGDVIATFDLLRKLNTRIFEFFEYSRREEMGVQMPCRTIALGSGSCRDFAVFMMEAARHLGFAARFVTGYILMGEGQHGATHAWTEIYIPGTGWRGFDPTNNKLAGYEHVSVAVAREHDKACPLSGSWDGPMDAFDHMNVSVQVVSR